MTVYFIQVCPEGPIKIGVCSDKVRLRFHTLQSSCPWKLKIIGEIDGDYRKESSLHQRLAAHRMSGEWFHPHPDVLSTIDDVLKGAPIPRRKPKPKPKPKKTPSLPSLSADLIGSQTPEQYLASLPPRSKGRIDGTLGAIFLDLPPDLSFAVRDIADQSDLSPEILIIDILRDTLPSYLPVASRETAEITRVLSA